jgi:hypothetical protein
VANAGKAIDFANKSTAHADEAVKAADTATKAVTDAIAVAKAARDAELARLEQERLQGLDEARLLAEIEAQELAEYANKRAQEAQTDQAIKDLISAAEKALFTDGDLSLAAPWAARPPPGCSRPRAPGRGRPPSSRCPAATTTCSPGSTSTGRSPRTRTTGRRSSTSPRCPTPPSPRRRMAFSQVRRGLTLDCPPAA